MAQSSNKAPPLLSKTKTYDDWLKLLRILRSFTDLEKARQGPALVLSLEGEAQDAVLELENDDIIKDNGIDIIIERLDRLFKKDTTIQKYTALEAFETYRRPNNTSIRDFLVEFEKRHYKTKSHGTTMSDDLLAYRLIKAANLSPQHEQLIKATISELKFEVVKDQLNKTFSDSQNIPTHDSQDNIKVEGAYYTEDNAPEYYEYSEDSP